MLNRSAILMIGTFFALSAGVATAKVAPTLDMQGQDRDQLLQRLINQPQGNESCEIAKDDGMEDIDPDAIGTDPIGVVAVGALTTSKLEDACPIPAPSADPYGNVASL